MKRTYGPILLAAQLAAVPVHASVADLPLPLSVRSLLDDLGLAREEYAQATEKCRRKATNISGIDGFIAVDAGSYDCRGGSPDFNFAQRKSILTIDFRAKIPVTKCVSFDQAEHYLIDHGWRRVSNQPARDLLPISVDFTDEAGSILTLAPYLQKNCLTSASLKISAASIDH
ncbi:hypothetical protein [Novosphingobium sp. AAP1]|uniref:hypothetical protein n=1 Tax=Novosphingobium sp. AAP1 TaxID=1523413 RepID=UPI0012E2D9A0|nr:hypothetical protein [Novosphingobium sp. AAP1]